MSLTLLSVFGDKLRCTVACTQITLPRLRQIVDPALDSVSVDLIRKYFRKVVDYQRAYMEGKKAGKDLDKAIKVYKSHRRIFFES